MKFTKALSLVLSVLTVGGSASLMASAAENDTAAKTYNYVALGDSIASGYGLSGGVELDPALILSEDLIANPVRDAYAAVFGSFLEELGQEYGVSVNTTNLSSTAYRAQDVSKTITTEGYKGEIAEWILDTFVAPGTSEVLLNYHGIYNKYLPDADLVSIQLGGNDVIMGILVPMVSSENPVLRAVSVSVVLTLFGTDMTTAIGGGLQVLSQAKDTLKKEDVIEAAEAIMDAFVHAEDHVTKSANEVRDVVSAVRTVNETADIALIGMFNPYGNSLEYNGQVYNIATVIKNVFARAAAAFCDDVKPDTIVEEPVEEEAEALMAKYEKDVAKTKVLAAVVEKLKKCGEAGMTFIKAAYDAYKAQLAAAIAVIVEESSYPIQYMLLGKNLDAMVLSLNTKLMAIADECNVTYVDVYDISNECNLDPHPIAAGHREIAEILYDTLSEQVAEAMKPVEELVSKATISANTIKVGDKVKVRCAAEGGKGDYQYAVYYKKARNDQWHTVHDFGSEYAFNIKPAIAAKYEILVKVKDQAGTVATQNFQLQVTSK